MRSATSFLAVISTTASALAADSTARVTDRAGNFVGTAEFTETASGLVWVVVDLKGIARGVHGVHVHESANCSAADFKSAGGHLAGDRNHGILVEGGPHPGDMPNVVVGTDERLRVEFFSTLLNHSNEGKGAMFDADGSAFIVHSDPDDYMSQPSGEAGERIACGVIERVER